MTSRGAAMTNGGVYVNEPLALPTTTVWVVPSRETGVAAGEPGYDE